MAPASQQRHSRQTHARPPRPRSAAQLRNDDRLRAMHGGARAAPRQAQPRQVVYVQQDQQRAPKKKGKSKKMPTIHLLDWVLPAKVAKEVLWGRRDGAGGVNLNGAISAFNAGGLKKALPEAGNIIALEVLALNPHFGQPGKHNWDSRLVLENVGLHVGTRIIKRTALPKAMNKVLRIGEKWAFGGETPILF